jgi:hypothetical protein
MAHQDESRQTRSNMPASEFTRHKYARMKLVCVSARFFVVFSFEFAALDGAPARTEQNANYFELCREKNPNKNRALILNSEPQPTTHPNDIITTVGSKGELCESCPQHNVSISKQAPNLRSEY